MALLYSSILCKLSAITRCKMISDQTNGSPPSEIRQLSGWRWVTAPSPHAFQTYACWLTEDTHCKPHLHCVRITWLKGFFVTRSNFPWHSLLEIHQIFQEKLQQKPPLMGVSVSSHLGWNFKCLSARKDTHQIIHYWWNKMFLATHTHDAMRET